MPDVPLLTTFRKHVASVLEPKLGVGKFVHDRLEGPIDRKAVACIWSGGTMQVEGQADDQLLVVFVRIFNPHRRQRSPRGGRTVNVLDALEEAAAVVQTTWRAHSLEGGVWYSHITRTELDIEAALVEVEFVARSANPAMIPA